MGQGVLLLVVAVLAVFQTVSCGRGNEIAPKATTISFPASDKFVCSIDPKVRAEFALDPKHVCTPATNNGKPTGELVLSADVGVISARYQWRKPIQLWKKNSRYVASFNAYYVLNFNRDAEFTQRPLFSGGGLAFAITPDTSVEGTGQETFGLFPIDEQTGASLRGAKTKTVAVEMDLSRIDDRGFDPLAPHIGIDINSMKSVTTKSLGDANKVIDVKYGVWIEYDALKMTLKVFLHKVKESQTPQRSRASLAISYAGLDLAKEVKEFSYVGFGSRVPETTNGVYVIYDFKFSTKWVLGNKVNK